MCCAISLLNNYKSFHHRISISDLQQEIEKLTMERNQVGKELEETQATNKEKVCIVHEMI